MNVHSTLTTHPKFILFKQALNAPDALEYLFRLWGHCQTKQLGENWGRVPDEYVEAICGWTGAKGKLAEAFSMEFCGKPGWIHRDKKKNLIVTGWDEHNKSLINRWEFGKLGGRPKGKPQAKPADNPRVIPTLTQAKPADNLIGGEGRGGDLRGLDGSGVDGSAPPSDVSLTPTFEAARDFCKKMGMDYSEGEVRAAWLSFEGTKINGAWMWGKRPATDWRSVLEARMADNRMRSEDNAPAAKKSESLAQLEAEWEGERDDEKRKALWAKIQKMRGGAQ